MSMMTFIGSHVRPPSVLRDISSALGRYLLRRIFQLHVTEDDRLDRLLATSGIDACDIRLAVISHLHFDHVGGIAHIPRAHLLVSDSEWAQLSLPHPEYDWILKEHIRIPGANWQPITFRPTDDPLFQDFDGVYDVVGDGSMMLVPTPGHTPGSLSMLIRQEGWAPILLVADLTYAPELLDQDILPGTGNAAALRASYAKVRKLKQRLPDLEIVAAHDFGASDAIARATRSDQASQTRG